MSRPSKNQHVVAIVRQIIGLGQQQLAARLGISKSLIQKIEVSQDRSLTRDVAKRIADHTGVELDWLLAGEYRKPPLAAAGGLLTREKYERHRAWMEGVKPATDAQWAQFQEFAQGATIGLAGGEQRIPDDPKEQRCKLEGQFGQELKLEVTRAGKRVGLPNQLRGLDRALAKRMLNDFVLPQRRVKVSELRAQFEALTQAAFEHRDGDFLLWQLKERLAEFKNKHRLT